MQDTKIVKQTFATLRDFERIFQSVMDQAPRDAAGFLQICEVGAFIVGDEYLDTVIFPDLIISAPVPAVEIRGFSAETFPELSLCVDSATATLLLRLKSNQCGKNGMSPLFLKMNDEVFINKEDLLETFSEDDQVYLAELGFTPGMTVKQWSEKIRNLVRTTSRTVYEDTIRFTYDLPVTMKWGTIGTRHSLQATPEFIAKSLMMTEFRVPGDTSFGYATSHNHPERQLNELELTLARKLGEDLLRKEPSLAEVRNVMQLGSELVCEYPSAVDMMTMIDSQYNNARIMRPQVRTERQYQELVLVVVSTSTRGIVIGSKIFSYYDVAKAGEIETFDKLIVSADESGRSDKPDFGLISEGILEIARYTRDELPDFMGTKALENDGI